MLRSRGRQNEAEIVLDIQQGGAKVTLADVDDLNLVVLTPNAEVQLRDLDKLDFFYDSAGDVSEFETLTGSVRVVPNDTSILPLTLPQGKRVKISAGGLEFIAPREVLFRSDFENPK